MNQYDETAFFSAYAQMLRSQEGLAGAGEWPQMQPLFPPLAGRQVLDLGCGYGWHCAYAAAQGAAGVTGIDQSSRMIQTARQKNAHPVVRYQVCGLEEYDYPPQTFDLVVSNLALHYVQDLTGIYRRIHRTLKPGGVFLMNIEHPVFTAGVGQRFSPDGTWPVDRYFEPGARTADFLGFAVTKYHHTLTQILGGLLETGFCLQAVEEVQPPPAWRDAMPEEMRRPMMLLVRAQKA